jgi:tetratricopeptide (TPR) repeat protein
MNATLTPADRLLVMLRSDPANESLLQECVATAFSEKRPALGREAIDLAREARVSASLLDYLSAQVFMNEHRWPEAISLVNGLLAGTDLPPLNRATALFTLGLALFHSGSYSAAVESFERGLQISPDQPSVLPWLLRALHQSGDPAAACEAWHQAPDSARSAEAAGVASLAFFDTNDHEQAAGLATACLAQYPDCIEALVVRAAEDLLRGDAGTALPMLDRAVALNPGDGRVWSTFATAQLARGDVEAALAAYERATQTFTEHIGTWSGMAWAHIIRRDFASARRCLERAMAIDDRFGETHGGLAVICALQDQREEAERLIITARRLDPQGFAWRYAQALLDGEARDAQSLQRLANRLLASRSQLQSRAKQTLH